MKFDRKYLYGALIRIIILAMLFALLVGLTRAQAFGKHKVGAVVKPVICLIAMNASRHVCEIQSRYKLAYTARISG